MEKTDEIIKKVVCDRDGNAFMEMLCLPNKELENVIKRMKELTTGERKGGRMNLKNMKRIIIKAIKKEKKQLRKEKK